MRRDGGLRRVGPGAAGYGARQPPAAGVHAAGQSRWLSAGAAAGIELALDGALAVQQVEVGPNDIALIGPGTLYRLHAPEGSAAMTTWCAPARVSPINVVAGKRGSFTVRHFSDAMLMA
jgi:hypothetical protein